MADEEKKEETEKTEETATSAEEEKAEGTEKATETPIEEKKEEVVQKETEEKTNGEPKEETKNEKPAPSGKFKDLIKEIESMSVSDLAELVKALEERFGVSAAAPVAVAGAPAASGPAPEAEEKANFTIMLKDSGAQKIAVIKAVREINQELGLKEAKDLVDSAPKEVKKDVPKAEAEEAKKKLEAAGATVELV